MVKKRPGYLAELKFQLMAHELGFVISQPFGEDTRYDFIVDYRGVLSRVQIKSVSYSRNNGSFKITTCFGGSKKTPYTREHIDYIVAHT